MIELILDFFSHYLIEFMFAVLSVALSLRWLAYRHSKRDEAYFSRFTRELSATLSEDKEKNVKVTEITHSLNDILGRVNQKLPERNLRKVFHDEQNPRMKRGLSLKEYVGSKHGLIGNIQSEANVFCSVSQPDFYQLTERVMGEDENWSKLFGKVPIDGVTRILDVLPTMFIILGVFGTFIGISMALPEVARMDFTNLEDSGNTLSQFVVNVTFAMKTSIAGIFFSIILTTLNTISPIEKTREITFEKVETVLQTLWYHLHAELENSSMDSELPKIRKVMEKILKELQSNSESKIKKAS